MDIDQPDQSCEGFEELQDPSTCQDDSIRLLWEVRVPQSLVGRFIGQKGRHINFLKKKSGAKIDIITPASSKEFKIILVAGTEEQMSTAAAMITEWFKKCELDLTQIQDPSTSQDQPETVDKFVWEARVPKRLVGSFIGPRGCNLKSLMKKSGAKIDIITPASSEEFEIISVDGKEEQIGTAAAMIIEWFKTSEVDLPPYTPRHIGQPDLSSEGVEEDQPETVGKFMWEARLPTRLLEKFKGPRGLHVKSLMEKSGAKIDNITPASSKEFKIILVAGTEEQISTAAAMITEWFKKCELDLWSGLSGLVTGADASH
ncbi:putative serine/threonine-protein kinase kinX isoform X1 [Astyanax mexicanus]|uniref:Putative serine/threonine-protein kinase kinX isoform X1 n=1 Tax=Astyanax mexicanus TaxID=7994 RepID=A0A8T2L1I7_ASTMX|nr:putative serine/threonine-protein kinase kinX isoform X1 [Astyanax mexicanus]